MRRGWDISSNFTLPEGYAVHEEVDGPILYTEDDVMVCVFHCSVTRETVSRIAYEHSFKHRGVAM